MASLENYATGERRFTVTGLARAIALEAGGGEPTLEQHAYGHRLVDALKAQGQGELVERRSKKGRAFYGCDRYPECDFVVWQQPLATPCPDCGGLLVQAGRERARCIRCGHTFNQKQLEVHGRKSLVSESVNGLR